jgi:hypothetical protein
MKLVSMVDNYYNISSIINKVKGKILIAPLYLVNSVSIHLYITIC